MARIFARRAHNTNLSSSQSGHLDVQKIRTAPNEIWQFSFQQFIEQILNQCRWFTQKRFLFPICIFCIYTIFFCNTSIIHETYKSNGMENDWRQRRRLLLERKIHESSLACVSMRSCDICFVASFKNLLRKNIEYWFVIVSLSVFWLFTESQTMVHAPVILARMQAYRRARIRAIPKLFATAISLIHTAIR